ncbi:MAG: helix-turn-helix domain-containing protein [Phycisphaeraceae bacterium]|nr:helix-turn-helix domain-containing protein [Phycisphaeraceae bacterium]MBX3366190.1 helix-turn-helix domain-containing protein [Phycisphaeraceae bacterium]
MTTPENAKSLSPLTVNRRDAARMLGISERLLWTLTNSGSVPHVRIGARVLYPTEQLRRWVDERVRQAK